MSENKRFVKYDGNTIVDLKLAKSWIISNGDVDLLIELLNEEVGSVKMIEKRYCKDCKYCKGIGYDFWCGEGHTEYEVFCNETSCPYYEFHDWSKGVPKDKRFKYYEHKGADYILENPNTELDFVEMLGDCLEPEEIVVKLNEFYDENNRLKKSRDELFIRERDAKNNYRKLKYENEELSEQLRAANELDRVYVDFLVDKGFKLTDVIEWLIKRSCKND